MKDTTMMMMQLNPPLPVTTPKGRGLAHMVIDYGPEADIVWVVFQDTGEIWSWLNQDTRAQPNLTFKRPSA